MEEKTAALQKLSALSTDMTFAFEFINKQGLALIISQVFKISTNVRFTLSTSVQYSAVLNAFYRWKERNTKVTRSRTRFNHSSN